jgi:pyruvate formate lyase activating enzyme
VKKIVELADLFLVDIKHIDNKKHIQLTTRPNTNTLKFIDYLESQKKNMWIRYVLVPGYTDQAEYIEQIGERFGSHDSIERIEILPYHHL